MNKARSIRKPKPKQTVRPSLGLIDRREYQRLLPSVITVLAVAFIGVGLLLYGHAATFVTSEEAENGTIAGNALVRSGVNASNGALVTFGSSSCSPSAILVNPCRPWIGAAAGNPGTPGNPVAQDFQTQFDYLGQLTGQTLDDFRDYHNCDGSTCKVNGLPLDPETTIGKLEISYANQGKNLDVNWMPDNTWSDADGSNGSVNTAIAQVAKDIKAIAPHKIFLTVGVEPQDKVSSGTTCATSSSATDGSPAQYKAMWQNVENIFNQQKTTNVIWTINYMSYAKFDCLVPELWPGDSLVDWIFYDTYDHDDSNGTTFADTSGRFYNYLASSPGGINFASKPWGLGEFGTCSNTSPKNSEQYFQEIASAIKANTYPNLKLYQVYADTGNNSGYGCLTDYDADPADPTADSGAYDAMKQICFDYIFDAALGVTPTKTCTP